MKLLLTGFLFCTFTVISQDKNNIKLLDNWYNFSITKTENNTRYSDCWGFEINGSEYAVLGSTEGTHIFEISLEGKFIERDFIKGRFSDSTVRNRDYKTYNHFLYAVCSEGNSSLQIMDLSYLPDSVHVVYDDSSKIIQANNIFVDYQTDQLYAFNVLSILNSLNDLEGFQIYSLTNPTSPEIIFESPNSYSNEIFDGFVHDSYAYLNRGNQGVLVLDLSDLNDNLYLQKITTQNQGFNLNGYINPKRNRYIYIDASPGRPLRKCTVNSNGRLSWDHSNFSFGAAIQEGSAANSVMLDDQFAYVAYNRHGFQIFDYTASNLPIANYQTYSGDSPQPDAGAYGVYSDLPSGRIIVSDRNNGLFLFDFDREIFETIGSNYHQVYPNPVSQGQDLTFYLNKKIDNDLEYDFVDNQGRVVYSGIKNDYNYIVLPINCGAGHYNLNLRYEINHQFEELSIPIVVR